MKLRLAAKWSAVIAALLAVSAAAVFIQGMLFRPGFHIGSSMKEVAAYFEAQNQHERRLPPFSRTCGAYGSSTNVWLWATSFYLREDRNRNFATRNVTLVFSTNGTLTSISSHLQWYW